MQTQFIRESMNQYFVIERNGEWEDSYEEKLFAVAEIPYFMSYDIRQINGSAAFYYHMVFKTSMKQAFECVELTTEKIENIIRSIVGVFEICNEYLVDPDNILFESEYVFFDIDSGLLKFCYYYDKKCGTTIRELVMEILQHVNKKYEKGSLRLLKFYHLLTDTDVSLEKLKSFIDEEIQERKKPSDSDRGYFNYHERNTEPDVVETVDTHRKKERISGDKTKKKGIIKAIKIMMGITAVSDIGLFAGLLFNVLTYEKMGYLFIGMAVLIGLVIIYMHFDPEETPEEIMSDYEKTIKERSHEMVDFKYYDSMENNIDPNDAYDCDGATVLLSNIDEVNYSDIQEEFNNKLYLEASDKDRYMPIHINSPSVLVGSMRDSCEFVIAEKGISRLHAKLFDKGDGMYIMDMNSTNGTYLNGNMLNAFVEYPIREGDMVSFADIDYYVLQERAQ